MYQMKNIVQGSFIVESIFEITSEKVEKSVYEYSIFEGCAEIPPTQALFQLIVFSWLHYSCSSKIFFSATCFERIGSFPKYMLKVGLQFTLWAVTDVDDIKK